LSNSLLALVVLRGEEMESVLGSLLCAKRRERGEDGGGEEVVCMLLGSTSKMQYDTLFCPLVGDKKESAMVSGPLVVRVGVLLQDGCS
jgi:hypothetical protein